MKFAKAEVKPITDTQFLELGSIINVCSQTDMYDFATIYWRGKMHVPPHASLPTYAVLVAEC